MSLNSPVQLQCYDDNIRTINYRGTCRCFTCVALHVRPNDSQCFITHIAADMEPIIQGRTEPWQPNEEQSRLLKEAVIAKMNSVEALREHSITKERTLEQGYMFLCCEHPEQFAHQPSVGKYAIQGIQTLSGNHVVEHAHGFLVQHKDCGMQ